MITIFILEDEDNEKTEKTLQSLKQAEKKIPGKLHTVVLNLKSSSDWSVLETALQSVETDYVSVLRAGESYSGKTLCALLRCIRHYAMRTDAVVPDVFCRKRKKKKQEKVTSFFLLSLGKEEDIRKCPACLGGIIFRTEAVCREAINPVYAETAWDEFVLRILMKKQTVAYAEGTRFQADTPMNDAAGFRREWLDPQWYLETIRQHGCRILDSYRRQYETVPLFIQAQVLYLIKHQFSQNYNEADKEALQGKNLEEYFQLCRICLNQISGSLLEDKQENEERAMSLGVRKILIRLKYEAKAGWLEGVSFETAARCCMEWPGGIMMPVQINLIEYLPEKKLRFDGILEEYELWGDRKLKILLNETELPFQFSDRYAQSRVFGKCFGQLPFFFELPLAELSAQNEIHFYLCNERKQEELPMITNGYQSRISSRVRNSYWCFENYMLTLIGEQKNKKGLRIQKTSGSGKIRQEIKMLAHMPFGAEGSKRMFALRMLYWLAWPGYSSKNIWITFDKLYKGGDCGEYFYRYVKQKADPEITAEYVIKKNCPDRIRLEQEGYQPLYYGTRKQKLSYLYAKMIFATHSSVCGFNGFSKWEIEYIQDRLRAVNTCIQHGLSIQDLTRDSNRIVNNNKRYYCASPVEIENLSKPEYDYPEGVLRLTGIPRYDGLKSCPEKQILITPTWRSYLAMPSQMGSARPYNPEFKNTEYYRIYQELITDPRLSETARACGYKVIFLLHPVLSSQEKDFQTEEPVTILRAVDADYEKLLTQSALMVTDYSGVQFDFAYMRKPIVYFHPPKLPPHYEEGGFHYETQGFGPICQSSSELTEILCRQMEQGCCLQKEYRERQDRFFAFSDHESCRRIYEDAKAYQEEEKGKETCSGSDNM